jgi:hypothetical protein
VAQRRHRRGGRTTPKGTRPPARRGHQHRHDADRPPLVDDVEALLEEPSPLGLLELASTLVELSTARPTDSWRPSGTEPVERLDGPNLFGSFALSGYPAMAALVSAIAAMHPDEVLAARLRRQLSTQRLPDEPEWLATMADITITETVLHGDVLDDGENVVIGWQWPDGEASTAVVYVDHNMGTIVKDAFVADSNVRDLEQLISTIEHRDILRQPIPPADAKARIVEALGNAERVVPPIETDSWPATRPLVEWLLGHLPDGGTGYVRPDWPTEQRERLLDEFVASPFGQVVGLEPSEVRELADPLVWFACDYGPGDPLRWSPVSVEIVLGDWYARKVFGHPLGQLLRLPDVLGGFVRFAHDRRRIPPERTEETLAALAEWSGEYREAISRPGRSRGDNALRLARIAAGLDPDDWDEDDDWEEEDDEVVERAIEEVEAVMAALVGGRAQLAAVTDEPLGDIAFDWSCVPDGLSDGVTATLQHLDGWASELFDDEVRTIARGVLAGVVAADPAVLRRSPRPDALAASILAFLLTRLTGRMSTAERLQLGWGVTTRKDLATATGIAASTLNSRAATIGRIVERADIDWPSLLHSSQRRELIKMMHSIALWRSRDS